VARKKGPEANTRQALVRAARELFIAWGYEEASVSAIVERAGLSKGTFFHYFPAKTDLLDAVVTELTEEAWETIARELAGSRRGAVGKLNQFLAAWRTWKVGNIDDLAGVSRAVSDSGSELGRRIARRRVEVGLPHLERLIEEGVAKGELSAADPREAARIILQLIVTSGDALLDLLRDLGPGAVLLAEAGRRTEAVLCAIEKMLGLSCGALDRPTARTISAIVAAFGESP
jgi:AcrR family transcriptional regulator